MKRSNAGFTLVEVLVSIAILGLVVIPACSGLLVSVQVNARAEEVLEAKLAVSSAVEALMATGISEEVSSDTSIAGVLLDTSVAESIEADGVQIPVCYKVTVTSTIVDTVKVETYIRAAEATTPENGGGGT